MTRSLLAAPALLVALNLFPQTAEAEVVAARTLRVGTVLEATDLKITGTSTSEDVNGLTGREMKRAIFVGRSITPDDVGPVTVIRRNDVVSLIYTSSLLGLRTEARALSSGGVGEAISVMNVDTRVTVQATVVGHNRVEVRP